MTKSRGFALRISFNTQSITDYIGALDTTPEELAFLTDLLAQAVPDDYDRLIQLCDSLAGSDGVLDIEERMGDVKRRYASYPQVKWDMNLKPKEYFKEKAGEDLDLLVGKGTYKP